MRTELLDKLELLGRNEYTGQKPDITRTKKFLNLCDNPQDEFPAVHITGTNGKGSVAVTIAKILEKSGYKAGLYTSPHLIDFRERIRIGNQLIPLEKIREYLSGYPFFDKRYSLTYFEILTAIAFLYFAEKKVDIAVVEVGLGGRYDATNVVKNKLVSIITPIDYDHTDLLGHKLRSITEEKTGIIKVGVPVITNNYRTIVKKIIKDVCKKNNSPLYIAGKDFNYGSTKINWSKRQQVFSYYGLDKSYKNLTTTLLGKHQFSNVSLALACIELLRRRLDIPDSAVQDGLKKVCWPGRFDIRKTMIFDGAHNPHGIKSLKENLKKYTNNKKITIVLSIMREKDYRGMCKELSGIIKSAVLFRLEIPRAVEPEILAETLKKFIKPDSIEIAEDFNDLINRVSNEKVVCVTGSLYLVGKIMEFIGM